MYKKDKIILYNIDFILAEFIILLLYNLFDFFLNLFIVYICIYLRFFYRIL